MNDAPARRARWLVALGLGAVASAIVTIRYLRFPDPPPDFVPTWFSARALLRGANPYELVGPGLEFNWPWPNFYPATAMVAAMPLAGFSPIVAVAIFVGLSTALLAYGVTQRGWDRLWIFFSAPYFIAVISAQWSPILTAAMVLPPLAVLFAAKPTVGLALFAATESARVQWFAIAGAAVLILVSLALRPGWPADWNRILADNIQRPPITRLGGPLILLALLRWRRPEARLIAAMGCVPQTAYWYEAIPLFLVPATRNETWAFSLVSAVGVLLGNKLVAPGVDLDVNRQFGALMVAFVYLPAVFIVLRRPNEGPIAPAHAALERLVLRLRRAVKQ